MIKILTNAADRIRSQGLSKTIDLAVRRLLSQGRSVGEDLKRGVSTSSEVVDSDLGFSDSANHAYVATDYAAITRALKSITIDTAKDVFVDIGCGKARVVLAAAEFPFRRVIGVELSESLLEVARQNLKATRQSVCKSVELVHSDATAWEIPPDVNVMFFFNPFDGGVLAQVCANIRRSLKEHPRRLRIIYVRPDKFFEREIDWRSWLSIVSEFPYSDGKVAIYESRPDAATMTG